MWHMAPGHNCLSPCYSGASAPSMCTPKTIRQSNFLVASLQCRNSSKIISCGGGEKEFAMNVGGAKQGFARLQLMSGC